MKHVRYLWIALACGTLLITGAYATNYVTRSEEPLSDTYASAPQRRNSSGGIDAFVKQKYRGCRILDRDYDNGFIEVKIRHNGVEKILLFDEPGEWLRTLWEIRREELPREVLSGLKRNGFVYRDIDDNDNQVVETSRGRFYAVQAKLRGRESIFLVSRKGSVLRRYTDDGWNDGRFPDDEWEYGGWDDGEDHFDEGDDEWRGRGHHEEDDGEDHFDEGDDEWDNLRCGCPMC